MNCREAEELIPLFVEADLDDSKMLGVIAHLERCASCRQRAAEFQVSQAALHTAALPEFDEAIFVEMRAAVQHAIAQTATRPTIAEWWQLLWTWKIAFAASIALLLLSGIVMYRRGGREEHQARVTTNDQAKTAAAASPTFNKSLAKPVGIERVFQPRMEHKNNAPGEGRASERKSENSTANPPSPERATAVDAQIAAAFIASSGANDPAANIPRIDTPDFTLPLALQAENATALMPHEKSVPEPEMLRMEIHTADPNIKIIWLTPKEPAATRTITVADTK